MYIRSILLHQNKIQLTFINQNELDAIDAIKEAHYLTTHYLDFTYINSKLNHLTISVGSDLYKYETYRYHTDPIKFNLEGINLKSHTNMLSFNFALLRLKADILSTVPYGIMTTIDMTLKNKF
jgi:hypothetical protein